MTKVTFVIPAHGRPSVSRLAFAGIRWALDELQADGIDAGALVIADDENLALADGCGFETFEAPNVPLGAKWNSGHERACLDGADFVVVCGSDDWVHPDLIRAYLAIADDASEIRAPIMCTRRSLVISPDGREGAAITVGYHGGDGIRMIPRRTLEPVGFRPTIDERDRAIDGGMTVRFAAVGVNVAWLYADMPATVIVEFKSDSNITTYDRFAGCQHDPEIIREPLELLADIYPEDLVEQAHAFYSAVPA